MRRPAQAGRLGHQREQRGLERPAGRDQQLERLVERPRVRHARREEGTGRAEAVGRVPAARGDAGVVAPAADRLAVAAHGVDLAVVGDVPERLGERPHGLRVGGVALVEQGEREVDRRREVGEQAGEAAAGDEALVDDGLRRRRDHRERRQAGRACRRVGAAAGAGERELELGVGRRRPAAGPAPGGSRAGRRRPRGRGHRARRAPCARRARPGLRRRARRRRSSAGSAAGPAARRRAGAKTVSTPGRSPAMPSGSRRRTSDGVRGRRTPAPSLDAPSAANAPRCPRAPRPPSARASTREWEAPPASATKPTPQASCS